MTTLIAALRDAARLYPQHPAIVFGSETLNHGDFAVKTNRAAAALAARGINAGDRVALYCPNVPEFAIAYVAIIKAGATVVPVNLLANAEEVAYILADSGARAIIYHSALATLAEKVTASAAESILPVVIGEAGSDLTTFLQLIEFEGTEPAPELDPTEAVAAILYTSGTTGFPKGAMLTHANLLANTRSVREAMHWRPGEDVVLLVLPMFHAFAATVGMLTPLLNGCAFVPTPKFEPDFVAETISKAKATIFLGVPSMYTVFLRLRDDKVAMLSSLRFCVSGGAALPVDVLKRFEAKFGIHIYEGDGPTECSPVTCVNPVGGLTKPGTVGLPVPGVEMKIVDDEGRDLPDGEVGEIAVRGANVMKGYWNRPEETAEVFRDGWFLTGDLGTRDEDGYFSIVDRKKDLIIVNGMNVYPRMIEEVLYRFPGLREAAVVAELHPLHGEIPIAYYVMGDADASHGDHELRAHCREHLGRHQVPKRFVRLEELPKNATGKILKRELRKHGEIERGVVDLL